MRFSKNKQEKGFKHLKIKAIFHALMQINSACRVKACLFRKLIDSSDVVIDGKDKFFPTAGFTEEI